MSEVAEAFKARLTPDSQPPTAVALRSATELGIAEASPLAAIAQLIERGIDAEQVGQYLAMQREWEAEQAKKAYVAAMAAFKAGEIPVIEKKKQVSFTTRDGDTTSYRHATLSQIVAAVAPGMGQQGLSHAWQITQNGQEITVTCVITHARGHSESVAMTALPDDSGKKNKIQQVASTVHYLERYTLMAATGVAATDVDDDGRAANGNGDQGLISTDQATLIDDKIADTRTNKPVFLRWLRVESLEQLKAKDFDRAIAQLDTLDKARK